MPGTRRKSVVREAGVQRSTRLVERQGMGDAWAGVEECDEATARSRAASGSGRALDVFAGADSGGAAAVLDEFLAHACSLDSFLQPSPSVAQLLRRSAKVLFDTSTAGGAAGDGSASAGSAGGGPGAGLLRELYVDGFEVEQIWLQVELLVRRLLQRAQRLCKRMPASFALYRPELDADLDTLLGLDGDDAAGGSEADSEIGEDDNENGEAEGLPSGGSEDGSMGDGAEPGGERDDAALEADAKEGQVGEMPARKRGREVEGPRSRKARKAGASERSLVEDRFFNLDELDRFLQQAEREEQELREQEEESSDEDEGAASRGVGERGGRDGNDTEEEEEEEEALDVLLQQANEHAARKPGAGKADGVGGGIMARDFFDDVGSTGSEEEDQRRRSWRR